MNGRGIWDLHEARTQQAHSGELAVVLSWYFDRAVPVIDLGCSVGFYARYLKDKGFQVLAFEGTPGIEGIGLYRPIHPIDLSEPIREIPRGQVLCLEVGEHIPAAFENVVLDNLVQATVSKLVLSWAVPGQNGHGHVNCRSNEYIIDQLAGRGLMFDPITSRRLRLYHGPAWWFRNTIMVFERTA
jgi:tryptophanyl-tRNA synthetase